MLAVGLQAMGIDSSEVLVFVGVMVFAESSENSSRTCGGADHNIRYNCPKLCEKERQTHTHVSDMTDDYKKGCTYQQRKQG